MVDFKRRKMDVMATVERIEYDPNRLHLLLSSLTMMVNKLTSLPTAFGCRR